ncbi:MAG: hypothetical protein JNL72_09995 [Flavipsychrobacter sp.]|nr:hypothetical protein [Flavipsychrobacter sp.]
MATLAQWATLLVLAFLVVCGFITVWWEVHPFFLDEWAIIYNIKYKTPQELWGQLDKTQQFPRVYLHIVQWFSSWWSYSYTSLRLPSFMVHCCGLAYCIYLSGRLFPGAGVYRWLWVLLYAAYPSSVFYFVLTKQYTMEMFLALVGLAQLAMLAAINSGRLPGRGKYLLLCLSFVVAPLFSYTYPIVAAPLFAMVGINTILRGRNLGRQWAPLLLGAVGIVALYFTDIRLVQSDPGMKNYWKDYYMTHGFNLRELLYNIYMYFHLFGRGGPLMVLVAVVGISAWLYGSYRSVALLRQKERTLREWLVIYSAALIWLSVALFILNKIPLNAHRLNAYKTPAAAVLIVYMFQQLHRRMSRAALVAAGAYLALQAVFIVQPCIRQFTDPAHQRTMLIYANGKTAITLAQQERIPLFTTSMTLYPHQDIDQADWVIKCYPLYPKDSGIPVYPLSAGSAADSLLDALGLPAAVVTTGDSVFVLTH